MKHLSILTLAVLLGGTVIAAPDYRDETWRDTKRNRDVPVRIRMPSGDGPFPILLISHGLGGSRRGIGYLAEAARNAGWYCVNLQHAGSDEALWKGQGGGTMLRLKTAIQSPEPALQRVRDVSFAIDNLARLNQAQGKMKGKLRLDQIALAGHSFGAWTAYASVGRKNAASRRFAKRLNAPGPEKRIRAIIALSPQGEKTLAEEKRAVADITVPSLNITGGNDTSRIQPDMVAERRRYSFDTLPGRARPAYLLWFDEADHMVFGGNERERQRRFVSRKGKYDAQVQEIVGKASVAFLKREVLGDKTSDLITDAGKAKQLMQGLGRVEVKRDEDIWD